MQARNFFKQVFKNLNSKNIFYRYNQEVFTYADLKEFLRKFFTITNYLPKKEIIFMFVVKNHSSFMPQQYQ